MAGVVTSETCINEGTLDFIKQYEDLIGGDLSKSQVKEIVKKTEFILDSIKKTRNLDHFSRFLSTYELDQISVILGQIISLEKDFRDWSINKNKKRNKKIREMENNLEWLSKGPVLVSFFLFLNKKNWLSLFFGNSTSQLSQTPQLQFHNKEWGQGPYFWIRTDLGVRKISKQFLGASGIWIHSCFEGTLTEAIKVKSYKNGLLAYTFLRVSIDHSNNRTRLIKLNMWNDLAQTYIGHLSENDHVEVYGHLETYTGVDENGTPDVLYKLTVMDKIKRRDSNREGDEELLQSDKGSQLWMETDDTIHSLSKSNLGASKAWIFAKFDKGIVTQPVYYENRGKDILCARTYLSVPRSNCANRLILLEACDEEEISRIKKLNTNHRVSVSGFLLPYTDDVDQNGNAHYKVMPQELSFLNH